MNNENIEIQTIKQYERAELIEKKSKFIANIFYVESLNEAEEKIKEIKKIYYNARHNCFAFSILENKKQIIRLSDDGEPSGTAGEPILNIIKKNNLENILIIVTRYFGGTLLGTGGLKRAYSNVSIKAIKSAEIIQKQQGIEINVKINYTDNEKFRYYCNQNNIKINEVEYKENIIYNIELSNQQLKKIELNYKTKNVDNGFYIISYDIKCRKYVEKPKKRLEKNGKNH